MTQSSATSSDTPGAHVEFELDGVSMVRLLGPQDRLLTTLEHQYPDVRLLVRSNRVVLDGPTKQVQASQNLILELAELIRAGVDLGPAEVNTSKLVLENGGEPTEIFAEAIISARGRAVRAKTLGQKAYVDAIDNHTITFGIGPAGSGKTYLAMAKAVQALQRKEVERIILSRPAIEAGERLGFLPGTLTDKIDPYLRPLYDALGEMLDAELVPKLFASGTVEVAPLAYMRGRTLNNSFVVLDEAQNTTPEQLKMFLTRLGFGTTMVITGDITQVDLPTGASGLRLVTRVLRGIEDIHFATLTSDDVVRHSLVGRIVDAYAAYDQEQLDRHNELREAKAFANRAERRRTMGKR